MFKELARRPMWLEGGICRGFEDRRTGVLFSGFFLKIDLTLKSIKKKTDKSRMALVLSSCATERTDLPFTGMGMTE